MFSKALLTFALALLAKAATTAPGLVPFTTQAGVTIVQNTAGNGDTRIYYQPSSGTITEYSVSGPFDVGKTVGRGPVALVPASQALPATPISSVVLGPDWTEASPVLCLLRVLSEYYWSNPTNWRGGANCPECVTTLGVQVAPGNNALSATIDQVHNVIAVTFVDANNNGTLSEAVKRNGKWAVSPLPGY
ncbi:hypothetical protein DXG01_007793 [Tephrocybe rancida]|nr:hypothetical protein DXG01_007793 [Tephrocybe rancida]